LHRGPISGLNDPRPLFDCHSISFKELKLY
jgi:hypothetical protein